MPARGLGHDPLLIDWPCFRTVHVFRTKTGITKGISGTASTTVLCLELPDGIIDLDFLDDESLLLLSYAEAKATNPEGPAHSQADKSRAYVLRVRYRSSEWTWLPFAADALPAASLRLGRSDCGRTLMPIEVPGGSSTSKPAYMTVRPRSQARGEMPARLCLLGEDKTSYTVYALPEDWEAAWRARNG